MLRRVRAAALVAALAAAVALALSVGPSAAQEPAPTGAPAPNIVPEPNSGEAPDEAGDRGGALQLLVLALVVVGMAGAVVHLTRQSRRARPPQG